MKLLYNEWALIIELLEKVANDEKAALTERLTAIEALKKLTEQKIGWKKARREKSRHAIKNEQKDKLKIVQFADWQKEKIVVQ